MKESKEPIELWNCQEFRPRWPKQLWAKEVIFIDGKGHEAENVVNRIGMKTLMVTKSLQQKDNPNYIINFAEYRKSEEPLFKLSMYELMKYMEMFGYSDYEKFCKKIIPELCE